MKHTLPLVAALSILSAASASAQTPLYFPLPAGYRPTDVSTANGVAVVVGTSTNSGGAFRWTPAGGIVEIGSTSQTSGGPVRISRDGTKIAGIQDVAGIRHAALDNGTATWTTIPGLAATSGTQSTSLGGINADGTVLVGLGWSTPGTGHAYKWTQGVGTVDLMPFFNSPSSLATAVNGDGTVIVGHETNQGARWVNGVRTFFTFSALPVGRATNVNGAGTIVIGDAVQATPGNSWRWDAGPDAITVLPNLAGFTNNPAAVESTDDGSKIVGTTGSVPFGPAPVPVIWINNVPQDLNAYVAGLGMGAVAVDGPTGISPEGGVMIGMSLNGWVIVAPEFVPNGTPVCPGDDSGTLCPCANPSPLGANQGCLNSMALGGTLRGQGISSLATDSLALKSTQVPNGPALYFQGDGLFSGGAGFSFGDGLLCAGGTIVRLGVKFAAGNTSTYPGPGDPLLSVQGGVAAGDVRHYQAWYRDAVTYCTPAFFNLTNAVTVNWTL
jgi:probable HAF family extracellular repeat protein